MFSTTSQLQSKWYSSVLCFYIMWFQKAEIKLDLFYNLYVIWPYGLRLNPFSWPQEEFFFDSVLYFYKKYQGELYWLFFIKLLKVLNFRSYFEDFMRLYTLYYILLVIITNLFILVTINQHFLVDELYSYLFKISIENNHLKIFKMGYLCV